MESERAFTAAAPAESPPTPRPIIPTFFAILPIPLGAVFFNPPPGILRSIFKPGLPEGVAVGRFDNCATILLITFRINFAVSKLSLNVSLNATKLSRIDSTFLLLAKN